MTRARTLSREQVGVGVAEVGPVREAEVGELGVTDRAPEQVQVSSDVGGAHVARDGLPIVQALRTELP